MPTDQEETVVSGLEAPVAPEPKPITDIAETTAETPRADAPLAISGLGDDVTTRVFEVNHPAVVAADLEKAREQADNDDLKRDFTLKVLAARQLDQPKPYVTPPIPPRIAEQTRLEMEAGARRVAEFQEQQASRPRPPAPVDGSTTSVFRPEDYVPNQKKGEGLLASNSARTL